MASNLSPSAIHRIIYLVKDDDRPTRKRINKISDFFAPHPTPHALKGVNSKWKAIDKLYFDMKAPPPLDYLDSAELALVLKGEVNDADVHAIFAPGKPLKFWGCPPLLVSKIVETFNATQNEPTYLNVTITALHDIGVMRPSEAWPQIYTTHLPCYTCTTVETVEERLRLRASSHSIASSVAPAKAFAVEKFHVSRKSFRKRLTLEVHFRLEEAAKGTQREQSSVFHKMTIRLADETCGRLSVTANRSSATLLLLPEFASEVFGFLNRAHVGSSLLANRDLHDLIHQLENRLPVHHLTCAFLDSAQRYTGAYWLAVGHIQRDLSYTAVRHFRMPSPSGADNDCALIRHYLSNSYVADLQAPTDFPFAIKMLARLGDRNFSVGRVQLCAGVQRLSDFRSMDVVFGGRRMSELHLRCQEHRFVELVKTTDFFRMPTVQGLRTLKLSLTGAWNEAKKPRGHDGSKSPLWVSGIYLLRNCQHYRVDYWTGRHLRSIERKIVQICEEFERGKIADIVEHFEFKPRSSTGMNYGFSRDNLVPKMKVEAMPWDRINDFAWDVYRFHNSSTGGYLTACVGRNTSSSTETILHLVKGEVYPDASFAEY